MNIHENARLTPHGRAEMVQRVLAGERAARVAQGAGVSVRTVQKWLARYRVAQRSGLRDRSCRPHRLARVTPAAQLAQIAALRRQRWSIPRIAAAVGVAPSTVGRWVQRWGLGRLPALQPPPPVQRYEWARPGQLLHVDVKKLGRMRRVGHRITGDRRERTRGAGWEYVHVGVDDASRLAYVEVLADERQHTSRGFVRRAVAWLARARVRVERVMTDNGSAYRSHAFAGTCQRLGVRHLRTRPYTPRTNGKAERFIQTLLREWAYVQPYRTSRARRRTLGSWLHYYNCHRAHRSLQGAAPISRLPAGYNLVGIHS
jgi:transposase InsO family protein